jgi:uncharacterized protein DUF4192
MIAESRPQVPDWAARSDRSLGHARCMSRKGRRFNTAHLREGQTGLPVTTMSGPGDVAVMIPYLLGFQPVESLVLVALQGPRKRFGPVLRVDLVEGPGLRHEQVGRAVRAMSDNDVARVVVAAVSTDASRADPQARQAMVRLALADIAVEDAFRADGSRWWSYVCGNPHCCSPAGTPYDAGTARVAAEAVMAGMAFEPDRDALRRHLAPDTPEVRSQVAAAVAALGECPAARPWTSEGAIESAVSRGLAAPAELSPADTAWLALAVQAPDGAGRAMAMIQRDTAGEHYELWRRVTTQVDDDLLAPVACLAGFAAWLHGYGVLASHAVERVLGVAPGHPFALLIADLLDQAINPSSWPMPGPSRRENGDSRPPAA